MIKKINDAVEKFFEQADHVVDVEEIKKAYTLTADNSQLENISYIFSSTLKKDDLALLFTQLSSFFEIGFLFETVKNNKSVQPVQIFAYAKQLCQNENIKSITLPKPDLHKILKTNSKTFLKKYNLSDLDCENKMSAFLIRISPRYTLILMSGLAEPWLQLRLESLKKMLMRLPIES